MTDHLVDGSGGRWLVITESSESEALSDGAQRPAFEPRGGRRTDLGSHPTTGYGPSSCPVQVTGYDGVYRRPWTQTARSSTRTIVSSSTGHWS